MTLRWTIPVAASMAGRIALALVLLASTPGSSIPARAQAATPATPATPAAPTPAPAATTPTTPSPTTPSPATPAPASPTAAATPAGYLQQTTTPTTPTPTTPATTSPSTPSTPAGTSTSSGGGIISSIFSGLGSAGTAIQNVVTSGLCGSAGCALPAAKAALAGSVTAPDGTDRLAAIANALSADSACWSCMLYGTVYTGMRALVDKSYAYFVSGNAGLLGLATTILSIAVLVRVAPIVLGTDDGRAGAGLRLFFFRILVVFSLFLGNTVVSTSGSFLSDWFIDGPLAAGSELGTALAAVTAQNLSSASSSSTTGGTGGASGGTGGTSGGITLQNPFGTDLSQGDGGATAALTAGDGNTGLNDISTQNKAGDGTFAQSVTGLSDISEQNFDSSANVTGLGDTSGGATNGQPYQTQNGGGAFQGNTTNTVTISNAASGSVDLGAAHVTAAKAMLKNLHTLGVIGIVTGIWCATEGPVQQSPNIIAFAVMVIAGITLSFMFFMFTITFGLRYIDALIRSMLIFSLSPIFAFLWIFDSTRQMALRALKAGIALAAVFAVSGVVFTVAILIMEVGFQKAFANTGGGTSTATLQQTLQSIQGGGFGFLTGVPGAGSGTLNWLGFFILVGSCSLSIACAKLAFDLASQLFSFGRAELGIGKEVEGEVQNVAGQARNVGLSFIGGR